MVSSATPSASWTTASWLPAIGVDVNTSSQVSGCSPASEIEVARRALLEPEPVVLRGLLQELRRLLEDVLGLVVVLGLRLGAGGGADLVGVELARRLRGRGRGR